MTQGARRFCPGSRLPQGPRTATLRVCFHPLQLTKLIERANRNQFEAHEVGLSQRQLFEHVTSGSRIRDVQYEYHAPTFLLRVPLIDLAI